MRSAAGTMKITVSEGATMQSSLLESIHTFVSRIFGQDAEARAEVKKMEKVIKHHACLRNAHEGEPDALDKMHHSDLHADGEGGRSWLHISDRAVEEQR